MNQCFNIIAVHILPDCSEYIRKVLSEDGWFFFNKKYKEENKKLVINDLYSVPKDFYSNQINIQAIVGKNGSGKSSVIEIMLRLINNIASNLLSKASTDTELHFVENINAELFYEINGTINSIKCLNNKVYLDQGLGYIGVGKYIDREDDFNKNTIGEIVAIKDAIPILQKFFFTIVTNYSFHAYNAFDYQQENEDTNHVWLDGVFHKNDGYLTPLVLNPYRNYGKIDVEKEKDLTNIRLASLFYLFNKDGINFINEYDYNFLYFTLDKSHVKNKYTYHPKRKGIKLKNERELIVKAENKRKDIFNTTLKCYFEHLIEDDRLELAYKYLVYKTFSISAKYPNYSEFIKLFPAQFNKHCLVADSFKIKKLVEKIKKDPSHITLKIKQTLKFIDYITNNQNLIGKDFKSIQQIEEEYIDYIPQDISIFNGVTDFDKLVTNFPPPFYKITIGLKNSKSENITFEKMSSGERQFLFYMSTLLYHLKNLNSVIDGKESVKYEYVNIILEEVELYFHPEYQRQFISKLINYINACRFNNLKYFNIIIATHSPFILSDIPQDNIMFLDSGKQVNDNVNMSTFGANIYDMLKHSFFLKDGSMGAFAVDRINDTINYLNMKIIQVELSKIDISDSNYKIKEEELKELKRNVKETDIKKHKELIDVIDEPIIKSKLIEMYEEVANENEQIESLEKRIAYMQNKLKLIKSKR